MNKNEINYQNVLLALTGSNVNEINDSLNHMQVEIIKSLCWSKSEDIFEVIKIFDEIKIKLNNSNSSQR